MDIERIREGESYFRTLTPKELAKELRDYVENITCDFEAQDQFQLLNMIRAADLLEGVEDRTDEPADGLSTEIMCRIEKIAAVLEVSPWKYLNEWQLGPSLNDLDGSDINANGRLGELHVAYANFDSLEEARRITEKANVYDRRPERVWRFFLRGERVTTHYAECVILREFTHLPEIKLPEMEVA